ncbi:hypothetical protein HanRHA438_Chr02g0094161 [Helianthus annuus]|nr:hypothetical protein HanRHA438_Chr02g0094161 [Helianthus annuus]
MKHVNNKKKMKMRVCVIDFIFLVVVVDSGVSFEVTILPLRFVNLLAPLGKS